MGTALLILGEVLLWGAIVLMLGAAIESGFARARRRRKQTLID